MKVKKHFNYLTPNKVHFLIKQNKHFRLFTAEKIQCLHLCSVPIKKIIHFIWLCRNISFFSSSYDVINLLCRLPRQMPSEWVVEGNFWKSVVCLCPCIASTCARTFTQLKSRMRGTILKTQKYISCLGTKQPKKGQEDLSRRWDVKKQTKNNPQNLL